MRGWIKTAHYQEMSEKLWNSGKLHAQMKSIYRLTDSCTARLHVIHDLCTILPLSGTPISHTEYYAVSLYCIMNRVVFIMALLVQCHYLGMHWTCFIVQLNYDCVLSNFKLFVYILFLKAHCLQISHVSMILWYYFCRYRSG